MSIKEKLRSPAIVFYEYAADAFARVQREAHESAAAAREAEAEAERLNAALDHVYERERRRVQERDNEIAALHAEVERLTAIQKEFVRDNRDKTNTVRELQAALAGVLKSYDAYLLLNDPPDDLDEYDEMMLPAWRRAASLVPGFTAKTGAWCDAAALGEE